MKTNKSTIDTTVNKFFNNLTECKVSITAADKIHLKKILTDFFTEITKRNKVMVVSTVMFGNYSRMPHENLLSLLKKILDEEGCKWVPALDNRIQEAFNLTFPLNAINLVYQNNDPNFLKEIEKEN